MNHQSQQKVLFLWGFSVFYNMFGQLGHLQVIQRCMKYVGGNDQYKVL